MGSFDWEDVNRRLHGRPPCEADVPRHPSHAFAFESRDKSGFGDLRAPPRRSRPRFGVRGARCRLAVEHAWRGARARESQRNRRRAGGDLLGQDRTMPRRARKGYERVSRRLGVRHLRGVDGDDRGARAGVACQPHQGPREDEEEGAVRHRIRRPARALTPRGGVSARRRASRRRRDGDDVSSRRVAGDARRREPKRAVATRHRVEFHLRGVLRLPLQVDQVPQKRPRVGRRRVGGAAPRVFRRVSGGPGRDSRLGLGLDQELLRRVRGRRGGPLTQVGRRQSRSRRRAGAGGASCTKPGARGGVRARYFRARPRGRGRADARHLARRPRRAPGTRKGDAQPRRVDGCPRARRRACPGALPRGE